jgi:histidinol phosphatase-like enzyme
VLDNTYPSRASRRDVIDIAWAHEVHVHGMWLQTTLEEAQINCVQRMLDQHGRLLEPDEMRTRARTDPSAIPPRALFDYRRTLEPPEAHEGFARLDRVSFVRNHAQSTQQAFIFAYDGVLRRSRSGARSPTSVADLEILPGRVEPLAALRASGHLILGASWQPEIESGELSQRDIDAVFAATHAALGPIDLVICPHAAGPPRCWCRKPLPGMGVFHLWRHQLDPARCTHVGHNSTDRLFAERLGFIYREPHELFGPTT